MAEWANHQERMLAKQRAVTSIAGSGTQASQGNNEPADLYARWARATEWRGFARGSTGNSPPEPMSVRIIARAPKAVLQKTFVEGSLLQVAEMYNPDHYEQPKVRGSDRLYFTATLNTGDIGKLAETYPGLVWELAMPLHKAESTAQATTAGRYGAQSEQASRAAPPIFTAVTAQPTQAASIGDAIVIVDYGCPFMNERFARPGKDCESRIATIWDQDVGRQDGRHPAWSKPGCTGYGRELSRRTITEILTSAKRSVPPVDEDTAYQSLEYLIADEDPRRRTWFATHGGHVMDVAAGRQDPLAAIIGTDGVDAASNADIIFVQLPALTAADSSGGSLSAHLLDAVRYALHVCEPDARLVVNISYGTFAGSHDGSSLIETAFDQLIEACGGRLAIVLGAGNARQANCHVRRTVALDKTALLRFALAPDDTTDTFMELWYPRPNKKGHTPLAVRVRTAERDWSDWIGPGGADALLDPTTGKLLALLQHQAEVPHGGNKPKNEQAMVLLSLAPTAAGIDDDGPLNEPGLWEIEVGLEHEKSDTKVTFDAWIERDDPGESTGFDQGAQPCFIGLDRDDEYNTLSSIATGSKAFVVGGYRWSDASPASYSSLPSLDRPGSPMLLAPCEEDAMSPGIVAAAVRSNDVHRMNGTSVAAPVVTRRLFNLDRWPATFVGVVKALVRESKGVIKRGTLDEQA
ncbi:S8 family serine peptidase [Methylibium rhizosphaerae]|uniref:S8 family serine peptidase n=1 Tax=Methylibium rhizosphaerae TaxID=2570323 RepID=UPI0015E482AC|nr:S8 family serine peptidase [Methylibium rhizosphaerae]